MTTLIVSGWNPGFQKVDFTGLLRQELGYSLSRAKDVTDSVVAGEHVELQVVDSAAERVVAEMDRLGAKAAIAVNVS